MLYMKNKNTCMRDLAYMRKCSNGTYLNGWKPSKQTGEKQVDKLIEMGIMSGWATSENFWLDEVEWLKSWRKFWTSQLLLTLR